MQKTWSKQTKTTNKVTTHARGKAALTGSQLTLGICQATTTKRDQSTWSVGASLAFAASTPITPIPSSAMPIDPMQTHSQPKHPSTILTFSSATRVKTMLSVPFLHASECSQVQCSVAFAYKQYRGFMISAELHPKPIKQHATTIVDTMAPINEASSFVISPFPFEQSKCRPNTDRHGTL
jgi:hypothetical protein